MTSELQAALKRLDQTVKVTKLEAISFRELAIKTQKKLKKIPFWVPPLLFLFWFLYKLYVKFGLISFVSIAVSLAVSTNLVFLIPKGSRQDQKEDEIKVIFNTSPRVEQAVQGINSQIQEKKLVVKQVGEKIAVEKPLLYKTFKLSFGDEFRASIIQDLGTAYLLLMANGERKKIEKELIERIE